MKEKMTVQEYFDLVKQSKKRKSKYKNKKKQLDGYVFDSQLEADYYLYLKLREKAKDILFFRVKPKYLLQPAFEKDGKKYNKIEYIADFEVHHLDGTIEVIDTKGYVTDVFRIKEKLFHAKYPYKLTIVKEGDFKFI